MEKENNGVVWFAAKADFIALSGFDLDESIVASYGVVAFRGHRQPIEAASMRRRYLPQAANEVSIRGKPFTGEQSF